MKAMQKIPLGTKVILLLGAGAWVLGVELNQLVIAANGDRMPVYLRAGAVVGVHDTGHVMAGAHTALSWLADWISLPIGSAVSSPGDYLISGAYWLTPILLGLAIAFRLLQRFD